MGRRRYRLLHVVSSICGRLVGLQLVEIDLPARHHLPVSATNTTSLAAVRINGVRATALVLPSRSIFAPPMTAKTGKPDHYRGSIKRSSR
jgi:hypothetical protein